MSRNSKNGSSQKSTAPHAVLTVVLTGVISAGIFFATRSDAPVSKNPIAGTLRSKMVEVGGIERPQSDVRSGFGYRSRIRRSLSDEATPEEEERRVFPYGRAPGIPIDSSPAAAAIAQTLRTGERPERVTHMIQPDQFDAAAFERNPEAYLSIVEPGRIWQPAQPGPDVPRLESVSKNYNSMRQGESVRLRTRAVPGAPVTYTSFDLGAFQNQLTSITVAADDQGVAEAVFTGTAGTINHVTILAASPMTSGQARFMVNILPPVGAR